MTKKWLIFIFFFATFSVFCGESLYFSDTLKNSNDSDEDTVKVHSIKRAALFSAVLPGAGQVYNHIAMPKGKKKAYWKVPLIYAGLGATTYFALKNNTEQKALKEEYNNRVDFNLYGEEYMSYDNAGIIQLYQQKVNRRDLFFLGLGLVYLLQVADAAVEAHFVKFDISEDLSMKVRPAFIPISYGSPGTVGISLQLSFK
jgi:hypothetical protein